MVDGSSLVDSWCNKGTNAQPHTFTPKSNIKGRDSTSSMRLLLETSDIQICLCILQTSENDSMCLFPEKIKLSESIIAEK